MIDLYAFGFTPSEAPLSLILQNYCLAKGKLILIFHTMDDHIHRGVKGINFIQKHSKMQNGFCILTGIRSSVSDPYVQS